VTGICERAMSLDQHRFVMLDFVVVALASFLSGCGGQGAYPAHGKVTFDDGKPLDGAVVVFRSLSGDRPVTARGQTQGDGTFELSTYKPKDGAVLGSHKVAVSVPQFEHDPKPLRIDPRFCSFEASGLEFTVTSDPAQNDFVIQVTPPKR
jgi:hypothetical protein